MMKHIVLTEQGKNQPGYAVIGSPQPACQFSVLCHLPKETHFKLARYRDFLLMMTLEIKFKQEAHEVMHGRKYHILVTEPVSSGGAFTRAQWPCSRDTLPITSLD